MHQPPPLTIHTPVAPFSSCQAQSLPSLCGRVWHPLMLVPAEVLALRLLSAAAARPQSKDAAGGDTSVAHRLVSRAQELSLGLPRQREEPLSFRCIPSTYRLPQEFVFHQSSVARRRSGSGEHRGATSDENTEPGDSKGGLRIGMHVASALPERLKCRKRSRPRRYRYWADQGPTSCQPHHPYAHQPSPPSMALPESVVRARVHHSARRIMHLLHHASATVGTMFAAGLDSAHDSALPCHPGQLTPCRWATNPVYPRSPQLT